MTRSLSSSQWSVPWATRTRQMEPKPPGVLFPERPSPRLRVYAYELDDEAHKGPLKVGQTTKEVTSRVAQSLKHDAITHSQIVVNNKEETYAGSRTNDIQP